MTRPTPTLRKTPGLSATGFTHSDTGLASVTKAGIGSASAPRRSRPRSPASTKGPHIKAARLLLSANPSTRSVFGNTNATVSPVFHVRFNSTYDPGLKPSFTSLSFTFTSNPAAAHDGRRRARVKAFGFGNVSFSAAESPSGKFVSIARLTSADFHVAVEGT